MSVFHEVVEHLKVKKVEENLNSGAWQATEIMADQLAALAAVVVRGEGRIWRVNMVADGQKFSFSKDGSFDDFAKILHVLTKAKEIDFSIDYDYCWRSDWQLFELVGPFILKEFIENPGEYDMSDVFYSMWCKADGDCDDTGSLVAYGECNGKSYSGPVPFIQVSSIPEGIWDERSTPVIIDTDDSFDAKAHPELIMACQELSDMAEDPQLDIENGLYFYPNNVTFATEDQRKRFPELVKRLLNLVPENIEVYIYGIYVDSSREDARLMTIDHDGQDLVIKVAEIL